MAATYEVQTIYNNSTFTVLRVHTLLLLLGKVLDCFDIFLSSFCLLLFELTSQKMGTVKGGETE